MASARLPYEFSAPLRTDRLVLRAMTGEAASAMLSVAFNDLELHRVRAEHDARNRGSAALCKRLGMRREALFREDMWFKGMWSNTAIYAILDREWAAAQVI